MLPDYIDGDLPDDERRTIEAHLGGCAHCCHEHRAYVKTWEALDVWKDIEPDPLYRARFWEKADAGSEGLMDRIAALFTRRVFALVSSLAVVIAVIAVMVLRAPSEDLFRGSYLAWHGVDMREVARYAGTLNDSEYDLEVAFAPMEEILDLPEYVEEGSEKDTEYYPELKFGTTDMRIMEGTRDVIDHMISQ